MIFWFPKNGEGQRIPRVNQGRNRQCFATLLSSSPISYRLQLLRVLCSPRRPSWPSRTGPRFLHFQSPSSPPCKKIHIVLVSINFQVGISSFLRCLPMKFAWGSFYFCRSALVDFIVLLFFFFFFLSPNFILTSKSIIF